MTRSAADTICAIATAPGRGGVGIVRVSGSQASSIYQCICGATPRPRHALYTDFIGDHKNVIDSGIALYFQAPHSFTGEDVCEFQAHGGPVILDMIIERCLQLGARLAGPGEFSERAFLNDKLDLAQAEAIADLINASSRQAAAMAVNNLQGAFSREIDTLVSALTELRVYVESAIDFPDEEIDFLNDGVVATRLEALIHRCNDVQRAAQQGQILREGMRVVLAGRPNAGKSTLMNALAERDVAIVTDIAGTTRDTLTEHIHIDGMPLHITDTAGIRETDNKVELIGIERAWQAIDNSDQIILLIDAATWSNGMALDEWPEFLTTERRSKLTVLLTKTDLCAAPDPLPTDPTTLAIAAPRGEGLDALKKHLLTKIGFDTTAEGRFGARRRHIDAIERALGHLLHGQDQLKLLSAGELLAEDLRHAQNALGEITGRVSADALLGEIFASFCIGK